MGNVDFKILGNYINILSGHAFKSKDFNKKGLGLPVVRIRDVGKMQSNTYYDGNYSESYILKNGDLLIGMDGDFRLAKWNGGKALLNQRVCKIKANDKTLNNEYMYYILPRELKRIEDTTSFATVKHLSVKKIKNIKIPLPPLPEQKRIAKILDAADGLRKKDQLLIDKYTELGQSLFLDMFGDPVVNPMGWDKLKLDQFCEFENGDRSSKYPSGKDIKVKGKLFLSSGDIKNGRFVVKDSKFISLEKFDSLKRGKCRSGDVLMTLRGNGTGKSAIFDCSYEEGFINAQMVIIRPDNRCLSKYLVLQLNCKPIFRRLINLNSGSAQPQLSATSVKNFEVFVPPIKLQNNFAEKIKAIETQKDQAQTNLKNSNNLFNSLLQKAFKGEL